MEILYQVDRGLVDNPIGTPARETKMVYAEYPEEAMEKAFPDTKWGYCIRRFHDNVFVFSGQVHWIEVKEMVE